MTTTIAFWFFLVSGRVPWIYPLVKYAIGFVGGWVSLTLLILFVALIKARHRKTLEQAKNLKFVSQEKGFLDHIVNQKKAFKNFTVILTAMATEIEKVGKTSNKGTARINLAKKILGDKAANMILRISSKTASKYNWHSEKMERQLLSLEQTTDLLIESTLGYLNWFIPKTEEDVNRLLNDRASLAKLTNITSGCASSIQLFRESQVSLWGTSQDLNTAINRMVNFTDGVLQFMQKAERHWGELIKSIDKKLNNSHS